MTPHRTYEELAVGYAVHALEPEDELVFLDHLSSCARCRKAVDEHSRTLGDVALAVPPVEPPPALLAGLRARIAQEPRSPRPASGPPPAPVTDLASRRLPSVQVRRSWLLTAAAGVVAVVVALTGYSAVLRNDRDAANQRGDRLAAAVQTLERPGARTVRLAGFDGQVRAVAVATGGSMSLVVDGLQPNDEQSVYVLWGQDRTGKVLALSAFDVRRGDVDVVSGLPLQVPVTELTALMVTHEKGRVPPPQAQEPVLAAGTV